MDLKESINEFFYDLIGLSFPGFIFTTVLIFLNSALKNKVILWMNNDLLKGSYKIILICAGWLLISYIIGHVVKRLSVNYYRFMELFFDKWINKWFSDHSELYSWIKDDSWPGFFLIKIRNFFTFKMQDYCKDDEKITKVVLREIRRNSDKTFPDKWHNIFKYSSIAIQQESLVCNYDKFLAKYTLYRSLSFSFVFFLLYYIFYNCWLKVTCSYWILLLLFLLYITFHEKYKRYWTLCGNEALMAIYYYLFKIRRKH